MEDTDNVTVWSSPRDGTSLEFRFGRYTMAPVLSYMAKCIDCGHPIDSELVSRPALAVAKRWGQATYRMTCGSMSKEALDAVMQTVVDTILDETLDHVLPVKCANCQKTPVPVD